MKWATLKDIEPRTLSICMVACLVLTSLAAWLYVLKKPLAEYRELRQNTALLEARVNNSQGLKDTIGLLDREVEALNGELVHRLPVVDGHTFTSGIIDFLGRTAASHQVTLQQITPGESTDQTFRKLLFDLTVSGSFQAVHGWMRELEEKEKNLVVRRFTMIRPGPGAVSAQMSMVVYQPPVEER